MNLTRLPAWACWLIATLPVLAVIALAVVVKPGAQVVLAAILLYSVWAIAFAGRGWRRLDETSREAQKSASMWGGSFGLLALLIVCAVAMTWQNVGDPLQTMIEQMSAKVAQRGELWTFTLGVIAAGVAGTIGYAIVWTGWWLSKRR